MKEIDYATNTLRIDTVTDWQWINFLIRWKLLREREIIDSLWIIDSNWLLIRICNVLLCTLFHENIYKKEKTFCLEKLFLEGASSRVNKSNVWRGRQGVLVCLVARMFCCRKKSRLLCTWQISLTIHSRDDDIRRLIITYFHPTLKTKDNCRSD